MPQRTRAISPPQSWCDRENQEGEKYALAGPDLKEPKYFGYGAGIALRKGEDALKGELNAAIKTIRSNGSYKTMNDKYFAKFNIDVYGE